MTRQRDDLHAVDDWLGPTKRVPLTGRDVRRQPKVAFGLRNVNIRIWKDALSILSGQAADVIGVEVREQNDVDFFRRVACAAEAAHKAPQCSPTPPGSGTRIDQN